MPELGRQDASFWRPMAWCGVTLLALVFWSSGWPGSVLFENKSAIIAKFWTSQCHGLVCTLCPRTCFLPEGGRGWCRVRVNRGGRLYTLVYNRPAALHVDPIEKKPIFHFLPGSTTFSLATVGCNLACDFCQNWSLSTANPEAVPDNLLSPEEVVNLALRSGSRSIAYTYSEPVVFYEYMTDIAKAAHAAGLYNIMITAGYIQPEPLRQLLPLLDVIKVDFKGNDPEFYRKVVGGELAPVLRTLKQIAASGVQLEVVNLMVPVPQYQGQAVTHQDLTAPSDDITALRRFCRWVRIELGADTPLFFSRFSPAYRMENLPATPVEAVQRARTIAREEGLRYVYVGNTPGDDGENTYCPDCGTLLIRRFGLATLENRLVGPGGSRCPRCGLRIPGIWFDERASAREQKPHPRNP